MKMKKILTKVLLIISMALVTSSLNVNFAQGPKPPPSGGSNNGHDLGGNQGTNGGGAPIDGGLEVTLLMAAVYGGFLLYKKWKKGKEISEING